MMHPTTHRFTGLLVLLALGLVTGACSSSDPTEDNEFELLTSGRWYVEDTDTEATTDGCFKTSYVEFHADGTGEGEFFFTEDGDCVSFLGVLPLDWELSESGGTTFIVTSFEDSEPVTSEIQSITESRLTVTREEEDTFGATRYTYDKTPE